MAEYVTAGGALVLPKTSGPVPAKCKQEYYQERHDVSVASLAWVNPRRVLEQGTKRYRIRTQTRLLCCGCSKYVCYALRQSQTLGIVLVRSHVTSLTTKLTEASFEPGVHFIYGTPNSSFRSGFL